MINVNFSLCLSEHHALYTYMFWWYALLMLKLGTRRTLVYSHVPYAVPL
jgi:hypothetical protein